MQQTAKYQFNLVDSSDDFSPAPLNQNMERVEQELDGLSAALAQGLEGVEDSVAALAASVGSAGKTARIHWGSYTGSDSYGVQSPSALTFPFCPLLVIVSSQDFTNDASSPGVFFRPMGKGHSELSHMSATLELTWSDKGVRWYSSASARHQMNENRTYYYVAIGYDADAEG